MRPNTTMNQQIKSRSSHGGFSRMEICLLGTLLAFALLLGLPLLKQHAQSAKVDQAQTEMEKLAAGLDMYSLTVGHYPPLAKGLKALLRNVEKEERWSGPYLSAEDDLRDPWGGWYSLRINKQKKDLLEVCSAGPDQRLGTGDDLSLPVGSNA